MISDRVDGGFEHGDVVGRDVVVHVCLHTHETTWSGFCAAEFISGAHGVLYSRDEFTVDLLLGGFDCFNYLRGCRGEEIAVIG